MLQLLQVCRHEFTTATHIAGAVAIAVARAQLLPNRRRKSGVGSSLLWADGEMMMMMLLRRGLEVLGRSNRGSGLGY